MRALNTIGELDYSSSSGQPVHVTKTKERTNPVEELIDSVNTFFYGATKPESTGYRRINLDDPGLFNTFTTVKEEDYLLKQTKEQYFYCFDVPGLNKEDVKVSLQKSGQGFHLAVKGSTKGIIDRDYVKGCYIPKATVNNLDLTALKAHYENGILIVSIPVVGGVDIADNLNITVE